MKCFSFFALGALLVLSASCGDKESQRVPEGQLSAKMIHNPRSAEGVDPSNVNELPVLSFADTTHDFGVLTAGETVETEFNFQNTGKSTLVLAGATSSCGCTIPEFSREPIAPGGKGTLKVTFSSAGKQGHIVKAITVASNAYPSVRVLTITAEVKPEVK
jgi:hypothetical protein